jgi:hypothetical protein
MERRSERLVRARHQPDETSAVMFIAGSKRGCYCVEDETEVPIERNPLCRPPKGGASCGGELSYYLSCRRALEDGVWWKMMRV